MYVNVSVSVSVKVSEQVSEKVAEKVAVKVAVKVSEKVAHILRKSGVFQVSRHTVGRASPKGEVYARVPSFSLLSKILTAQSGYGNTAIGNVPHTNQA
ncbi:hypothetical protein [Bacteroides acidifaciens]|uniref:hypothetical protein n=1 Tax=Bacteroides acidifaciens TaxID=85831 RepID=UPI00260DC4AC|nr:hypothetical protein [Bacteroides acidifaciens]